MGFITMYDTRTGLKQRSPEGWLDIFPHLSRTPKDRAGTPTETWTHAELDNYAAANGVEFGEAKTKADKVAVFSTPTPAGDAHDIAQAEAEAADATEVEGQ